MKFCPTDRMLQLGVVPALAAYVKEAFPGVSVSLWQRDAKNEHRRIVRACSQTPGDGPFARQGHAIVSLAALLLGFHEAAPATIEVEEAAFCRMVDVALATPIVRMAFAGADPLSELGTRELARLLEAPRGSADEPAGCGQWRGSLRLEGDAGAPGQTLVCTVARCGLMQMCVCEKRPHLLRQLCAIEEFQARSCGVVLERPACMATGSTACELRCRAR